MEGVCRFCGQSKKLIKAHVVPEKFFSLDVQNPLLMIAADKPYETRCPIGIYDENILCADCDNKLGVYDEEAQKLFLTNIGIYKHKDKDLHEIPPSAYNYEKLRLFFISLIWRASISSMNAFRNVSLGQKFEKMALDILKDPALDREDLFSVLIFKLKENPDIPLEKVYIEPWSFRCEGARMYSFVFAGYNIHIKVDKRKLNQPIADFFLKSNSNLFILSQNSEQALSLMARITTQHNQLKSNN